MPITSRAVAPADSYTLLQPLPTLDGSGATSPTMDLNNYIGYIFKFAIAISAFLAVIMIIWGGFEYMTSEIPFIKTSGKERIQNAIFGLLMVLASYLILLTIDPRLVEINTTIPKINIGTKDVAKFNDTLEENLSKLSAEKQAEVNSLTAINTEKQSRIDELESWKEEQSLTPEQETELARLRGEVAANKVKINSTVAENNGVTDFSKLIDNIYNPDSNSATNVSQYTANTVPNTLVNGKYPTNSPNIIQNQFNERINAVLATDPQTAQTLAKQRDFYIAQSKEEVALGDKIKENGIIRSTGTQGPGVKIDNSVFLKSKLTEYQANINNAQKATEAGIPVDQYNQIMQSRVVKIQTALAKK